MDGQELRPSSTVHRRPAQPRVKHPGLRRLHYRLALVLVATLLLFIAAMLPFTVASLVDDVLGPPSGRIYPLSTPPESVDRSHAHLHVTVAQIDESQLLATLRVSGHHICPTACDWSDQVLLFSIHDDEPATEGLPPSVTVTLPSTDVAVTQSLQLPIRGQPIHFPFDRYELWLGVVLQWAYPDGTIQPLPPAEAAQRLSLTLQERLPLQTMAPPIPVDPGTVRAENDPYQYTLVVALGFARPSWVQILSVLLVLLAAGAAAFAVFMRPLADLVVNSGALVLGVWGIRSIFVPGGVNYFTAMDLSLSVIILFLLGAIAVRVLQFVYDRSELGLRPLGGRPRE
jgi:hypothetical protein